MNLVQSTGGGCFPLEPADAFSPDYVTSRRRFRKAAARLGWTSEAHPIGILGPDGDELTIDVALTSRIDAGQALVVSSGVHGVEGFFGSAVQLGLLDRWADGSQPVSPIRCVFLHGLNPFGFARLRRFDENNVDPNRNFLLAGEAYAGVSKEYAALDGLLNPRRPPSDWEPFTLKALVAIIRHGGMAAIRQAVAEGQYEFPRGLFFGGSGPSTTHRILDENLGRWLGGSRDVVHLDFHTGLGRNATCKLLIDYPLDDRQRRRLTDWFGPDSYEPFHANEISYDARGGLGQWCVSRNLADHYLFACAEFGTHGPISVLAGLRAENQAHHWGRPDSPSTVRANERLRELFCPALPAWRSQVFDHSLDLVRRAIEGLNRDRGVGT